MIKKNSTEHFENIIRLRSIILILSLIVVTNVANAESNKPKGKNIILDKHSSMYMPSYKSAIRALDEQLEQATSDEEIIKLEDEYKKIEEKTVKWYKDHGNPAKEKEAREKQKLLEDAILNEGYDEAAFKELRKVFPFSSIGYDSYNNCLEVSIEADKFEKNIIDKCIEKIRSIIGDEADLTISPRGLSNLY